MRPKLFFVAILLVHSVFIISQEIDRFALVSRHNIINKSVDSLNSLSVGNGKFAFTADITGLQTFPEYYEKGIPLGTMAEWAWHSFPNPQNYSLNDVVKYYQVGKDSVPYYYQYEQSLNNRQGEATQWLRENPHRLHLGIIGLEIIKSNHTNVNINDIKNPVQHLNLWTGELTSYFEIEGKPVMITTYCDQQLDRIYVHIESELLKNGRISIRIKFPYARHEKFSPGYDFSSPEKHLSQIIEEDSNFCLIRRNLNETVYYTRIDWEGKSFVEEISKHNFMLHSGGKGNTFNFSVLFTEHISENILPKFSETQKENKEYWKNFWSVGGAIDFSECLAPRAFELERRVVLSQYLTKIQCTGNLPPQETGLTYNSWHGKFHLEMHWWHALHFILWNRTELIEKQLDYYFKIENAARQTAEFQGYKGIRWPKMTDPGGRESPSKVGVFLIWQQPHLIYFADLVYRSKNQDKAILNKYSKLVFQTAEFMASYARFDSIKSKYVLGTALIPAQERFSPDSTINPSFELAYWHWGLETAQLWRKRLGMERNTIWQNVIDNLSSLPVKDSLYLFTETATDSYTKSLTDHPMVLGLMGFLPQTPMVNRSMMLKTQKAILEKWQWETCWGWDFPLAAMNATMLDKPEDAINLLLMKTQKNTYLLNGHNYQEQRLPIYLPGNGGLLTAIALMCTHKNKKGKNGFPDDGNWKVRFENIQALH